MYLILLSGGSGRRLWPLSGDRRSKQFLRLLAGPGGNLQSMLERVSGQIAARLPGVPLCITTAAGQEDLIRAHLRAPADILTEPSRRNTYPAIALSAAWLKDEKKVPDSETVIILPVDPYADDRYFDTLRQMEASVCAREADLLLMGITPTYPSEKYGYMLTGAPCGSSVPVTRFAEKPALEEARALLSAGALWNGGVFACRLEWLLDTVARHSGTCRYRDLLNRYDRLEEDSFDRVVVEHAERVACIPYSGLWKDLGTWNTLTEEMGTHTYGNVLTDGTEQRLHALNELDIPLVVMGGQDLVVAAAPDGILVAEKEKTPALKSLLDHLPNTSRYREGPDWQQRTLWDRTGEGRVHHLSVSAGGVCPLPSSDRPRILLMLTGEASLTRQGTPQQCLAPGAPVPLNAHTAYTLHAGAPCACICIEQDH